MRAKNGGGCMFRCGETPEETSLRERGGRMRRPAGSEAPLPKMVGVAMEGGQAGFSMNHGSAMRRPSSSRWLGW